MAVPCCSFEGLDRLLCYHRGSFEGNWRRLPRTAVWVHVIIRGPGVQPGRVEKGHVHVLLADKHEKLCATEHDSLGALLHHIADYLDAGMPGGVLYLSFAQLPVYDPVDRVHPLL